VLGEFGDDHSRYVSAKARTAATRQPAGRHPARMPQTGTVYDETTAWSHHLIEAAA